MRALYICYFGLREPLVQTQVLPYLRQLSVSGINISLLTFEPEQRRAWSVTEIDEWRARLEADGIRWLSLPYHKRPSAAATTYDILAGARLAARMVRKEGIDVLHARAHIPLAMALLARRVARCKLIFDIRGLMAEEYADAGIWGEGSPPFRAVKRLERAGIRRAEQIVVLTERLRDWLIERKLKPAEQIEVIPCCVDFARFAESRTDGEEAGAEDARAESRFEVVYAGSLLGLYLVEEMGRFFKAIKEQRPDAYLRILSVSPPEQGSSALMRAGLDARDFCIGSVSPAEVPTHLRRARLGLSFRKAAFAQIAASPTKIPEYLAVGLPVVCNAGIGDMDELVERERVGVVLHDLNEADYRAAAERALMLVEDVEVRERCKRIARERFDLTTIGGQRYLNVYLRLESGARPIDIVL
jgi:glycosyltransferase involved in cell wall biosynthesis